jgi:hypothetical protein
MEPRQSQTTPWQTCRGLKDNLSSSGFVRGVCISYSTLVTWLSNSLMNQCSPSFEHGLVWHQL